MTRLLKENIPVVTYELLKFNKVPVIRFYLQNRLYPHPGYSDFVLVSDMLKGLLKPQKKSIRYTLNQKKKKSLLSGFEEIRSKNCSCSRSRLKRY